MKYKVIGLVSCICALVIALLATVFSMPENIRKHQHEIATGKAICTHDEDVFCSHLPLVKIYTDEKVIPGRPIYGDDGYRTGQYVLSEEGLTTVGGTIEVIDNPDINNHLEDSFALTSLIQVRVRGRSSRSYDKSSYAVKLVREDGSNNNRKVMGMDAHHEWVLYGPFLDKTLIRNYMWYNIAGETMDYAPNVRFCEAFVNDEYMGLYVMIESITAGNDGARLNLTVNRDLNSFTGYLLRMDQNFDRVDRNIRNFTTYAKRINDDQNTVEIIYPGRINITEELKVAITKDFSDFEKALYSYDYNHKKYGYKKHIDVGSFVDYFLINEFTGNYDAGWLSTYLYKDMSGLLRFVIWDFNSACGNYREDTDNINTGIGFKMQDCLWYFMLMKDEDFTDRIIRRYHMLRKTYFSEEYLYNYIDETVDYLGDAIQRNYDKWGYTFLEEYYMLEPEERNPRNYDDAVTQLKDYIDTRIKWMDENIEVLRQYSVNSKIKKFDKDAN